MSPQTEAVAGTHPMSLYLRHNIMLYFTYTEQGVAMLSSVLNSDRAILVNIQIMRAFAKLRKWFLQYGFVLRQIKTLEKHFGEHDKKINLIFKTIRQLIEPPPAPEKPKIGFHRR